MSNPRDPDVDPAIVDENTVVDDPRNPPAQYPNESTPQEDLPLPESPVVQPLEEPLDDDE